MAKMNLEYYAQEDLYSDGDIENKLLEMVLEGVNYEDLPEEKVEFPMIYHFSEVRENILAWYPFREHCTILEIGAGCGAITGLLCRKAERVVAVELSKRRAEINLERHKNLDNLEIMVGNLNDMEIQETFDYVILNGVLEYAMSFTEGEKPYHTFLRNMGKFLKDDGRLLIAIENRLGLKYFAGAPEDHTDLYFLGIDRYRDNRTVRTFSRMELQKLLSDSGFPCQKMYYPYPDYKFPLEIFTDETLETQGYGKQYPVYTDNTLRLFQEGTCARSLMKEKVLATFVNSFLVDAGKKESVQDREYLYVKLNQKRAPRFRLMTAIVRENGKRVVEKSALHPDAEPFLEGIAAKSGTDMGDFRYLSARFENGKMSYPYLNGVTYQQMIKEYIDEENIKAVFELMDHLFQTAFQNQKSKFDYQGKEFQEVFGTYPGKKEYMCVSPANIDLICENIFAEEDGNRIIDYEWVFSFWVPVAFIIWRTLHELYTRIPKLNVLCSRRNFLERYGIERSDDEIFLQWTMHFVYQYVGCDRMDVFQKQRIQLPLEQLVAQNNAKKHLSAKVYYDLGEGLNEEHIIRKNCRIERKRFRFHIVFPKEADIKGIRWDFHSDSEACMLRIDRICCNCRIGLRPMENYIQERDATIFLTSEPMYFVDCWDAGEISEMTVEGIYVPLDLTVVREMLKEQIHEKDQLLEELDQIRNLTQTIPEKNVSVQQVPSPGMKRRVKGILKKMLGRGQAAAEEESAAAVSCLGSIDVFQINDRDFHVVGWAYDTNHEMQSPRIVFYQENRKILESEYMVIYRKDVAENLGRKDAEASGFALSASVRCSKPLRVCFEYGTPDGPGQLFLGTIPETVSESEQMEPEIIVFTDNSSLGDIRSFRKNRLADPAEFPSQLTSQTYDILIPVYNGFQYLEKLFSSLEKTRLSYRLILVDDKSPDEKTQKYLEAYAETHPNVILVRNEENLGFVRSVNRGLQMAEHHVALVNTDVEVPEEWLERLMLPIAMDNQVATATPFTTCGTICSFPNFCEDNVLFEGMDLWQIDNAFRLLKPQYPSMPTGVGFCMGMNLNAIRQVGLLDAETFGKGYGEENDWCQRAVKAGYRNVLVDNLFVYHKHGGSFLSDEKMRLLEHNLKALSQKHPNYNRDTAEFCRRDPARPARLYAQMYLLNQILEKKVVLAFDHSLGGGATEYLEKKTGEVLKDGACMIIVRYNIYENKYRMIYRYKKYQIECFSEDLKRILELIPRIDEIWVNELVTYQGIYKILRQIIQLKERQDAYLKMLLHDFFAICPAVNLMDDSGKYCAAADAEVCNCCVPRNRSNACLDYQTGSMWRTEWRKFLEQCDEITAFSDDSARLLKKAYPGLGNLRVIPHTPHYLPALDKKKKTTDTLNIGLLGVLCYKKGLQVVKDLLRVIEEQKLNITIRLLGVSDEEIDSPAFSQTGRYTREMLPRLTLEQDIDIFLIPSIWPETFSYTASEIMSMNMPIAVFPIGAPVERVVKYEKGTVIENGTPEQILQDISTFALEKCKVGAMPVDKRKILFIGEEISFASRYRVEHFREQLLMHGVASDFIQVEEALDKDFSNYQTVVFYRCSDVERVPVAAQMARRAKCAVYYDIDDLIFNYDKIRQLHFLKGSEYRNFRKTTENIHSCMELCDGYLTSTETLAEQIRKEFPGKPVVVNRNCASMEMQVLSHDAAELKEESERLYVAYFSGSKTHDQDFALIEDALLRVMDRHPNVYLKLVGVLSEDKMKRVQNRIEKIGFMDWKKLPEQVASVDINLMPLENTLFHCCKSENKWMEAALVKTPSVMSRNAEMELAVENGITGFLCSTTEEWENALEKLITDSDFRKAMGENANTAVMERYTTQNTGDAARKLVLGETDPEE